MRAYILISGAIFGAIALVHVVRLLLDWPAEVAGWGVPLWVSWIAIFAAGALSVWGFCLAGRRRGAQPPA